MSRLCLQWPHFGPNHEVRYRAVLTLLAEHGGETVGIETAGAESRYAFLGGASTGLAGVETLFPGDRFERLDPRAIERAVLAALDRLQPDAVAINSYSLPDARAALIWCRSRRRTAVLMTDSKADDGPRVAWRERLKSQLVRSFDAALVGGAPHRDYVRRLGIPDERIFTGCDVVDNEAVSRAADHERALAEASDLPGLSDGRPYFLTSARFIPRKNLSGLIDAYAAYHERALHPWRLILLGDGPMRPALEDAISDKGLRGEVWLAGFQPFRQTPAYYARASALVHPPLADQWGLVVNEAMACGLPVIVSRQSGCAVDLVREGVNGWVFDARRSDELTECLVRMSSGSYDVEAMGRASREIITAWGPDRFARNLWAAVQAAGPDVRGWRMGGFLVARGLSVLSRSVASFHRVEA